MRSRRALALVLLLAACTGRYVRRTTSVKFDRSDARIERGHYLVDSVGACGTCHSGREGGDFVFDGESVDLYLAGGYGVELKEMGLSLFFPNLTPDPDTGLGLWSDDEIARAIRDGVTREGRLMVPAMPYRSFHDLSDDDVQAIVAYLRSIPAVKSPRPRRASKIAGLAGFLVRHGAEHRAPVKSVPAPEAKSPVEYGGYLVRAAGCPDCHARKPSGVMRKPTDPLWMAGGAWDDLPGIGRVYMRNLTPDPETGLGRYDAAKIVAAMRSGTRLDGKKMAPPMSLYMSHWSTMTDDDLQAIAEYLTSLPAAKNAIPPRRLVADVADAYGDGQ